MLRLRTLGGLTIEDETGPLAGAIARKRSLALLALVAMGTEQGISRDRLLAYLWPESDTDRARNNLKQVLFQLRQDLREDVFARGAGVLRLETGAITVDGCDFQAALERGNPTTAVTLYRGPFLDGFYLPGLADFERWVESERVRLAQRFAGALEALAATATRLGDHHGAADWWRRLAAHDPLSTRYALGLMRSLAQSGDRAAALEHARVHEEMVHGELDSEPDPEIGEYVKQLRGKFARWTGSAAPRPPAQSQRQSPTGTPRPPAAAPAPAPPASALIEKAEPASAPPAETAVRIARVVGPMPSAAPSPRSRFLPARRVWFWLGLVALASMWWERRATPVQTSPDRVAVLPFTFSGVGEPELLGSGVMDLLSASLDGAGQLRSVHPSGYPARLSRQPAEPLDPGAARDWAGRLGAQLYVLGDVVATGNRVRISAAMYDRARDQDVAQSSVEGETGDLFHLVDRLAANLIASRYREPHQRLTRVAAVTTRSLPALKAYIEGEDAYRGGRYAEAIDAIQRAVGADSTFALAYYRLSDAADRAGRPQLARSSAGQALRYRQQLGERERRLIEAQHAWLLGRGGEAESLCRSLVADYPDDVEALIRLARIASVEGKRQEADSLVRRARVLE